MGHYAADMRPEWFEEGTDKRKSKPEEGCGKFQLPEPKGMIRVTKPQSEPQLQLTEHKDVDMRQIACTIVEVEKLNAAVDAFAVRMKARLEQKAKQGFSGWDKASPDLLRSLLLDSVTKESTLDLGIYAMMLAHRGISMKVSSNEN